MPFRLEKLGPQRLRQKVVMKRFENTPIDIDHLLFFLLRTYYMHRILIQNNQNVKFY